MRHPNIPENIDYHDPAAPWNQQELTEEEYANQILLDHGAYEAAHRLQQGLKEVKRNCPSIWNNYFTDGLRHDALDYFSRIIDALEVIEGASDSYAPAEAYHYAEEANELLSALRKHHEALQQRYNEAVAALNRALAVLAARENDNEKVA